ncbi:hypothetical protein RBB77_15900 [Tunturibacter psychrotolerans]|uniref:Flp pilus-assembly TadG-like N-terminal domain-containing protein n=1 Tax=Tunturiibacter psychrotolerans TaxID=3069686 RepID=A0AAU7ZLL0_9BACT
MPVKFLGHKSGGEGSHESGRPHWLIAVFTLALVVCAVFQVLIMYAQTQIMTDGGKQTDKLIQASERNAIAAQRFAESAESISDGMQKAAQTLNTQALLLEKARLSSEKSFKKTLDETKENYRLERRAWIAIEDFELISFEPGRNPEATVIFSNSGKTPALNVKAAFLGGTVLPRDANQSQINNIVSKASNAVPGIPLPIIGPLGHVAMHPREDRPLPQLAYDKVKSGAYDMYFTGRVEYDDVSTHHQWLTICMKVQYIGPKPDLRYCSAGNETSFQIE